MRSEGAGGEVELADIRHGGLFHPGRIRALIIRSSRQTRKAGLLKQQYRSIERLNDAWGKAWTDFDPIHPAATGADYVEMFLRWQWAAFAVAEQARFVSETIRAAAR